MYEIPSTILRYGVIVGLLLTLIGIVVKQLLYASEIVLLGLAIIVITPLASLLTISVLLLLRRDIYGFTLSLLTISIILLSIILSQYR